MVSCISRRPQGTWPAARSSVTTAYYDTWRSTIERHRQKEESINIAHGYQWVSISVIYHIAERLGTTIVRFLGVKFSWRTAASVKKWLKSLKFMKFIRCPQRIATKKIKESWVTVKKFTWIKRMEEGTKEEHGRVNGHKPFYGG